MKIRATIVLMAVLCTAYTSCAATARMATETFVTNKIADALHFAADFTTNNAVLVDTIVEVAPPPGDYAAVSNAAMSALQPSATNALSASITSATNSLSASCAQACTLASQSATNYTDSATNSLDVALRGEIAAATPGDYANVSNRAMSALQPSATNGLISAANLTFSNAVLQVGLNIDTNTVAAINALVEAGDELPIGGAATVGGLLLALAVAVAALKRSKADKSEIPEVPAVTATMTVDGMGRLRVEDTGGNRIWEQGYNLKSASSATLDADNVNKYEFAVNAAGAVTLVLPPLSDGKASDIVLDVSNPALDSTAADYPAAFDATATYAVGDRVLQDDAVWVCVSAVETAGAWTGTDNWQTTQFTLDMTNYRFAVTEGDDLQEMLTFAPGEIAALYFTQMAFRVDDKPTYWVSKQKLEVVS